MSKERRGFLNNIYGAAGGAFAISPAAGLMISIVLGFMGFVLFMTSILIWPYLFRALSEGGEHAQLVMPLMIGTLVGFLLATFISVLLAFKLPQGDFKVLSTLPTAFILILLSIYIGMIAGGTNLTNLALNSEFGGNFLILTVHGAAGIILALLPSLIATLVGWLLHTVIHFILDMTN